MAENELTPVTRKELFYDQIIQNAGGGGGGSTTIVPLSVDHNDTFTAPAGTAYSPVTVNVPTTGDYTTYVKTFASPEDVYLTADECQILNQTPMKIKVGSLTSTGILSEDNAEVYMIHGIGFWLLLYIIFGYWTVHTNGDLTVQTCFQYALNGTVTEYEFTGSTTLTFYVTSTQKQALDAL